MNKVSIYGIWDKKGKVYDNPYFAINDLMAKRRFMLMVDQDGPLKKWIEEFELHKLGTVILSDTVVIDKKTGKTLKDEKGNIVTETDAGLVESDLEILIKGKDIKHEISNES